MGFFRQRVWATRWDGRKGGWERELVRSWGSPHPRLCVWHWALEDKRKLHAAGEEEHGRVAGAQTEVRGGPGEGLEEEVPAPMPGGRVLRDAIGATSSFVLLGRESPPRGGMVQPGLALQVQRFDADSRAPQGRLRECVAWSVAQSPHSAALVLLKCLGLLIPGAPQFPSLQRGDMTSACAVLWDPSAGVKKRTRAEVGLSWKLMGALRRRC